MTQIGKKYNRSQLLESILQPSKVVEPKYVMQLVETKKGRVYSGMLIKKTAAELVLKNADNKEIRISTADVELQLPRRQSMMPELQLRDMTAQEVADLLEYLTSLK